MGLITETVEVLLQGKNVKGFEDKGYEIPRYKTRRGFVIKKGTKIVVKVQDLQYGSSEHINVDCDECNKHLDMEWRNYLKYVKEDGTYYCKECSKKRHGEKVKLGHLKGRKTFFDWCASNNRQDVLDRWDYKLNKYKPSEINCKTEEKYYFKCPRGIHESELKNICDFVYGHEGTIKCKYCNGFAQWGVDNIDEDFLEKYWDYNKNKKSPWNISHGSHTKVFIICQENSNHLSYKTECKSFCVGNRCPVCKQSKGEKRINNYLIKNNFKQDEDYIPQMEFNGLAGIKGGNLSYDFYLSKYNLLIEYQGEMHERFVKGIHKSIKDFKKQQEHDRRKKQYAILNNIKLLPIWYWDFDNIETILNKELNNK